jgi:peptidoglycan/LPS O-acetylase OafA/YrhL
MTSPVPPARTRHWADFVAILTGVALLAMAIWPRQSSISEEAARELGSPDFAWIAWIVAGFSALAAVLLAQRWRRPALSRGLLMAGGAALLIGYIISGDLLSMPSLLTLLLPAVALFASSMGVGPMPRNPGGSEATR